LVHADERMFQTGWFVESVVSAASIVLVVRTRRPFFRSPPSLPLLFATLGVIAATCILPWTPLAPLLGFVPLPGRVYALLAVVVILYIFSAELLKRWFYRRIHL